MLNVETERLELVALDLESMLLLKQDRILLEKHLEIEFSDHQLSNETKNEVKAELFNIVKNVRENPENHGWYTNWEIILKSLRQSIGSIGFSGLPNKQGSTEVHFYLDERYRNFGYATEALLTMIDWAFSNTMLIKIEAETLPKNVDSNKLLAKCGFNLTRKTEDIFYWQLLRENK